MDSKPARRTHSRLFALALLASGLAHAAPGSLDAGFGSGGSALPGATGGSMTMPQALQPDGKLLVANQFFSNGVGYTALFRLNPDGSPDTSFAGTGKIGQAFGAMAGVPYDILVQPDGKILLVGYTGPYPNRSFALARFNADGSRDTGFDGDGLLFSQFSPYDDIPAAAALQRDGKIVVGGYFYADATHYNVALVRYNANGSLDTGFDGDGVVNFVLGSEGSGVSALAVQADGKIVTAGYSRTPGTGGYVESTAVMRFNPDGSLDNGFGSGGIVMSPARSTQALALQADGKIVFAGGFTEVRRLNPDGSLDTGFDGDGTFTLTGSPLFSRLPLPGTTVYDGGWVTRPSYTLKDLLIQPDGRLVLTGTQFDSSVISLALRLLPDGTPDTGFGNQGVALFQEGTPWIVTSLIAQPDGKLLFGGVTKPATGQGVLQVQRRLANDADNNGVAEPWDLAPDAFFFSSAYLAPGNTATTAMTPLAGLGAGVSVPVNTVAAEFARNGSTSYGAFGYAGNGDNLNLRFVSGEAAQLVAGGMHAHNNSALILGPRVTGGVIMAPPPVVTPPVTPPVLVPLAVVNAVPQPGNRNVPATAMVMAVLDRPVNAATVTAESFRLTCNGGLIVSNVIIEASGRVLRLRPLFPLPLGASCTATLGTGIRDAAGAALPQNHSWSFTTMPPRGRSQR